MRFDEPRDVESLCWQLRQADYPRAQNRARIDELFNGFPPYSPNEQEENGIVINVNFLESTRLAHDARSQFYNAVMKPGSFFTVRTDCGPVHKRAAWGSDFSNGINKRMKRSIDYFEGKRSQFALNVLHGIGPLSWPDQDTWCPNSIGVGDVFLPSGTYLTMKNLPLFCLPQSYTAHELRRLTNGPNVDPGWQMDNVNSCIKWIDKESSALLGSNWPEIWAPEKMEERIKGDGGYYFGDKCPTIDVFDFYFYEDDGKDPGWRRRMVLDAWSTPASAAAESRTETRKNGSVYEKAMLLYTSGANKVCDKRDHIIGFQFADLSAVGPFRYHSVRSLGFLLYAVCHLQNRLRCKFNEAVFEALMMLFRVKSMDDAQRALKLDLVNRGFLEEGINPLTAAERYQVNTQLVELGIQGNSEIIRDNSSSYTQNTNYSAQGVEKTKFQVMAETNAMTSLVSAGLTQSYMYANFEYREIVRRFCKRNSRDIDVRDFQAEMFRKGIPEKYIYDHTVWEPEPERVMGAGNKTLEMTIAQQLMEWRDKFDPEPQRDILRGAVLAITDDPAKAENLVPETPVKITDSVHDAQLSAGVLMQGLPVAVKTGMNHIEYVDTLMATMGMLVQQIMQSGGIATQQQITGLQNMAQHITQHIQIIAQDEAEGQRVKMYGDQLGKMMNEVKAFAQRLQQMQQKAAEQNGQGGMDPKDQAKIQATMMTAQAKVQNTKESHAQRTAQRQLQWEQEMLQKKQEFELQMQKEAQEHQLEMAKEAQRIRVDTAAKDIETASNIRNEARKAKAQAKAKEDNASE